LIAAAASEARKRTVAAISSGVVHGAFFGVGAVSRSRRSSMARIATMLTVTPLGATSFASVRSRISWAAFDAAYGPDFAGAVIAAAVPAAMTLPQPRSIIAGTTALTMLSVVQTC